MHTLLSASVALIALALVSAGDTAATSERPERDRGAGHTEKGNVDRVAGQGGRQGLRHLAGAQGDHRLPREMGSTDDPGLKDIAGVNQGDRTRGAELGGEGGSSDKRQQDTMGRSGAGLQDIAGANRGDGALREELDGERSRTRGLKGIAGGDARAGGASRTTARDEKRK